MICGRFFRTVCVIAFLLAMIPVLVRADFEAVKDYRFLSCTRENIGRFAEMVKVERGLTVKDLQKKYPDKPKKVDEHPVKIAYDLLVNSAQQLESECDDQKNMLPFKLRFSRLQRLHYSIRADLDPYTDPGMLVLGWKCAQNYIFGPLKLKSAEPRLKKPIGLKQAVLEAESLCYPGTAKVVGIEELAKLNPVEISQLNPLPDHPAYTEVKVADPYGQFLRRMEKAIRQTGGKSAAQFDFSYARRVVFFDELKESASSPKITVKDRYGLKWKLKWGDEVHSDVVATRLSMYLGARYADLKFYSGPGETILILNPQNDGEKPVTQADLADMLVKSTFRFHLNRYVVSQPQLKGADGSFLGTGRVDRAMLDKESLDEKYLGCFYLKFKECQISLDNPALKRLGGVDLVNGSSREDRVARSSVVFSAWIANPDVKEDNSRSGLLWNEATGKFDRHVEFISDMGASFAGPFSAGCLTTLSANCVSEVFNQRLLKLHPVFLPESWKFCTWADARWMVRRIASLSREALENIFAQSGWPAFSQKLGVEKLLARRNDLVRAFGLTEEGISLIECDPHLTIRVKTEEGHDMPVIRGMINPLSRLVRKAQRDIHPEGLLLSRPRQLD